MLSFLGFSGYLPFDGTALIISFFIFTVTCQAANLLFSKLFNAVTNQESALITGLILFLLALPPENIQDAIMLASVAAVAVASKFIIAWNKKHIFNPAALSLFIFTMLGIGIAFWWVANPYMFPAVLVAGLLIVRKIRKFSLFLTFLGISLVFMQVFGFINERNPLDVLKVAFLSYPVIFFGTIMLTEPSTLPPTKKLQMVYAVLVGALFGSQYHLGPITSNPETALILGNIFSFAVSYKGKVELIFLEKKQIAKGAYEFIFEIKKKLNFAAGQYMEWTLPNVALDARGNRRYFTIASSPTESNIKLGVRFYENPSKFKEKLLSIKKGDKLSAGQLAGDFTLNEHPGKKYVFIAGGIGITPFRSMFKYLIDTGEKKPIIFFNINKTPEEIPYKDLLEEARKKMALNVIHVLTEAQRTPEGINGETGHLTPEMIKKYVPEIGEHIYYISGSNGMVNASKKVLAKAGVKSNQIVTDYFPGF